MEYEPKVPQYNTADKTSFAHDSVHKRWPIIIDNAIDEVKTGISETEDGDKKAEGPKIIDQLALLKSDMLTGEKLSPLVDDGFAEEIGAYNKEIEQLGTPSWHAVPWLFSECYMYRRIHSIFLTSSHWNRYDIFARQKIDGFRNSRVGVLELAARYRELVEQIRSSGLGDEETEKVLFAEMFDICLWGNATDLSLLTTLTRDDIERLQGAQARKSAEANILVNHTPATFELLRELKAAGGERRVDFVLDNAGFELFADLILAGYLLATGLATTIVLHPKSIPWFVSDVMPADFAALLQAMANPRAFFDAGSDEALTDKEVDDVSFLFQEWATLHSEGQLVIRPNRYWTAGGSFWRLPYEAKELYADLKESKLVIFKGDLNYRKVTADAAWDPTTPFSEAIGSLGPKSGLNVLSLRTCKGDVVVNLPPGKDEELRATEGGGGDSGQRRWAWGGKWAVISLSRSD